MDDNDLRSQTMTRHRSQPVECAKQFANLYTIPQLNAGIYNAELFSPNLQERAKGNACVNLQVADMQFARQLADHLAAAMQLPDLIYGETQLCTQKLRDGFGYIETDRGYANDGVKPRIPWVYAIVRAIDMHSNQISTLSDALFDSLKSAGLSRTQPGLLG
jgi:hypothetical protein